MQYKRNNYDDPIIEFITTAINNHLDEWYGAQSGLTITTPAIITYKNCFILRFPLLDPNIETRNILVKIRRKPKMHSLNQAILSKELHAKIPSEFNDLVSLHNFFKNRNDCLTAIRPLIYLEKCFAIVMEEFPSQTLREMLMDWRTILGFKNDTATLVNAAQLTGQLLNVFHCKVHKCHEIEEPFQPIKEEVLALFDRLRNASHQNDLANSLQSEFIQKINSLQTNKVFYSIIHGDLTCDNILYSKENQVCLVDIKTKTAPIYSDIGLIMIHPDVFLLQIFSFGFFVRKQTIQAYRAAILKGYFGDHLINEALVTLYCAIKMLDKWVMYEEIIFKSTGIKYLRSLFAAPLLRAYFKPRIVKYLDAINIA